MILPAACSPPRPRSGTSIASLAAIVLCLALTGCGQSTPPAPHVPGDPVTGLSIYKFSGCAACHAIATVSVGAAGPPLNGEGTQRSPAWLRRFLPSHLTATHTMSLTAHDQTDLIAYLIGLR